MIGRRGARALLAASLLLIVTATLLPIAALESDQIPNRWCLACGGLWLTDAVSNIALFLPLGVAMACLGQQWWRATLIASVFSLFIEFMQSVGLPPMRSPTLADVATNALGALCGVVLVHLRSWFAPTQPRLALRLVSAWTALTVSLLAVTSASFGPRTTSTPGSALERSPFENAPGYPWFGGVIDSARVGSRSVRRGWPGPIMVQSATEFDSLSATIFVRGRDSSSLLEPMMYVHLPGDTAPALMLSERGTDAEISVTRRAWDWGLLMPTLRVSQVFMAPIGSRVALRIDADVSRERLRFRSTDGATARDVALRLTPTLGWSMIQSVIGFDSRYREIARLGWLAGLMLPIGWLSMLTGRGRRFPVLTVSTLVVSASALSMPGTFHVSPIAPQDVVALGAFLALGAMLGWFYSTRTIATRNDAGTTVVPPSPRNSII